MDMAKKYDHKAVEADTYAWWKQKGFFKSGDDEDKEPYTIVIPPPNVTGSLHLGHAWDNALQDLIIRKKRMEGYDALYLPGMDHAGIATQSKIDARIRERGDDPRAMGRGAFLEEAWAWKDEYAKLIRQQWAALGLSVDYDKERFTLDEGLSRAVREVFIRLYEKGLVYRKERIIHWDVEARTALSNIEVDYEEVDGRLYYFKYELSEGEGHLLIATTRPETMFGDTALMVHPEDEARRPYIGKHVYIPGTERTIPVIADAYVDREFGTGAVKVTPAHDPNDFEVGERHGLEMPLCMEEDGTMNDLAGPYAGLDRFECRRRVVEDLEASGLLTKVETHVHNVGHSERTGVQVEPRLSKQWFVHMEPLAEQALEQSTAEFIPPRFEKTFRRWMEEVQDWCISRQLWWGHRIPAYYGPDDDVYVGENPPEGYVQDEDVLDTWFSSALWPFSTLGWPEEKAEYRRYYPTQTMVTGYDIIFFWVARMIFQGLEFTGRTPFKHVLIHGLIRDAEGRKMSKSLGNGVDPMDIKESHGIDTLRYFLTTASAPGQDLRFEMEKVDASWNFINKLWNISRFTLMHVAGMDESDTAFDPEQLTLSDRWILSRLQRTIREVNRLLDAFEFGEVARALYKFSWEEVAAWYVEIAKRPLSAGGEDASRTRAVLLHVWRAVLKMLHPFMPFVTEEIYQKLPLREAESIMISPWPQADPSFDDQAAEDDFETLRTLITRVRNVRNEYNVSNQQPIDLHIACDQKTEDLLSRERPLIERFTNPGSFNISREVSLDAKALSYVDARFTLHIPLGDVVDLDAELKRQQAERERLESEIARAEKMLANKNFVEKAPREKVDEEKRKLERYQKEKQQVERRIEELKNDV